MASRLSIRNEYLNYIENYWMKMVLETMSIGIFR